MDRWSGTTYDNVYFYGPNGKLLTVVQLNFNPTAPYVTASTSSNRIYFGKMLLGTTNGQVNTDSSLMKDRLGSVQPSYAYGTATGSGEQTSPGDDFATCWKDSSTGFEYAMNRYYSTGYGRFLTVDIKPASARITDPGTWNRYQYAGDDPVNAYDPTGMYVVPVGTDCQQNDEDSWDCVVLYQDDGGGGGGGTTNDRALAAARTLARQLAGKPGCDSLLTGGDGNAQYVLDNSTIDFVGGSDNLIRALVLNSSPSTYIAVSLLSDEISQYGLTGLTPTQFMAATILHELGHITGGLPNDANNTALSQTNTQNVFQDCFPQLMKPN